MKCRKCNQALTVNGAVAFCKNPGCERRNVAEWTHEPTPMAAAVSATEPPRAREPETREERVAYCLRVIAGGRWHPRMPIVLGQRWGCADSTIKHYAAEARRSLRGEVSAEDKEALRIDLAMRFYRIARKAEKEGNFAGAVAALREVERLNGLLVETVQKAETTEEKPVPWLPPPEGKNASRRAHA